MKTITVSADGISANLEIRHATAGDSLRREFLAGAAIAAKFPDSIDQTTATVFYPRCVACTNGTIIWPGHMRQVENHDTGEILSVNAETLAVRDLTPGEFVELPAEIFDTWWDGVSEVMPSWKLRQAETKTQAEDNQKKD